MSDPNPTPTITYGRTTNRADVLIIGAGISGLTTAIEMIRKGNGRNFIIVDKGNQVGGTWNDMRYPGCCCVSIDQEGRRGESGVESGGGRGRKE
jgi:succinate dehydrogenase/fumarate reductase flavoprotein subunit